MKAKKFSRSFSNAWNTNRLRQPFRLAVLFGFQIMLGVAIVKFADSPFLLVLFLGAFTIAALTNLEYMLYALMFFLPFSQRFRMVSLNAEMQIPTEPLLAILISAFLLRKIMARQKEETPRFPFWLPILAYLLSLLISHVNSPYLYFAAKGTVRAIAYIMTAVLTFEIINSQERLKRLFIASIVPATVSIGWTAIFLAVRIGAWRWTSAYEGLLFTNYSFYGVFVGVIFLILLSRTLFDSGTFDRVRWTILLGFYTIAFAFCFSRAVWVSIVVAVLFLLFQKAEGVQHKKIALICVAVMFLLLLAGIPNVSNALYGRFLTIFSLKYASNRDRLLRWSAALMMFLRHPIIGAGYNSFALSYETNPAHIGKYKPGAHNLYMSTLAEQGIVGFICWMWVLVAFFRYGFRLLKRIDIPLWRSTIIGLMSVELFFMVNFMACGLLHSDRTGVPFWLIYGLLPAVGYIAEEEHNGKTAVKSNE